MNASDAGAGWLDERLGWSRLRARLAGRRVTSTVEIHLAVLAITLFSLLVASGVLLMMHYRPSAGEAPASILRIEGAVPFGALVRGVHRWSSHGLVAVAYAYVLSLMVRRGYRAPGELGWLAALCAAWLIVGLALSGALLPWDERAQLDARVVAGAAGQLPAVGSLARRLLLGGTEPGGATLPRAFGFHVAVLPAALTALLAAQAPIVSRSWGRDAGGGALRLYPDAALRFAIVGVGALLVVVTLASWLPAPPPAASAQPPWYLAFAHSLAGAMPARVLGISGARALAGLGSMAAVVLVALPFVDPRGSRLVAWLGWVAFAAWGALTLHAML